MAKNISSQTQQESLKVAKATQKTGQTKEQTKLIAQGIEKGISEYKKQQKVKARDRDKQRKQDLKNKHQVDEHIDESNRNLQTSNTPSPLMKGLPWILLVMSWLSFVAYELTIK